MKKHIVCFGDSNTHGYDPETGGRYSEEERWTCLLEKYLGTDYLVLEEGLCGRTTVFEDPLTEGLNGFTSIYQCLMSHEPVDLLLIMLGTNDTKERFSANAENITKGMERLVQKAISISNAWHQKPNILIIAPPPIEEYYQKTEVAEEMGSNCVVKSRRLSALYKNAANTLGCCFLDAGSISGINMHRKDFMHLDKESHRLLAKKLSDIIPDIL